MSIFSRRSFLIPVTGAVIAGSLLLGSVASAQDGGRPLSECSGLWFSTSEDFRSHAGQLPGGQVVSDGDLLSYENGSTRLCARNGELLERFDVNRFDHGLDALDRIEIRGEEVVAALSTEIDSVNGAGQFTAGDLLFTNGSAIPNSALLVAFNLPRALNLGLDAVTIVGSPREKANLVTRLAERQRDDFVENPELLLEILERTNTDILFSTEGTPPEVQKPQFLDGDLLSARSGSIARSNADLLPALPAGIPDRGVDYGLDAYTPALDPIEGNRPIELLSLEINARGNSISDGDALVPGPSIYLRNSDLIVNLEPRDRDLGLDALAARVGEVTELCDVRITAVSHVDVATRIDPSTGLFDGDRPFGRALRVQGLVPGPGCERYETHEFQVRVSVDGGPEQAVVHPASLSWMTLEPPCAGLGTPYNSDPNGYFTLTNYHRALICPNDVSLAVWQSTDSSAVPNAVATARLRIAMRPIAGGAEEFSPPVTVRIDNRRPENLAMALYETGATTPFGDQCKIDGEGNPVVIDIRGNFFDDHFSVYSLTWNADGNVGGSIPTTVSRTYNSRPELTDMGTNPTPPATDALLETFDLTAAYAAAAGGQPLIECGYSIRMVVHDRTRLGSMDWDENIFSIDDGGNRIPYTQSFCLVP